jgi:myo-inositol-1(or 4)-monophosphatase
MPRLSPAAFPVDSDGLGTLLGAVAWHLDAMTSLVEVATRAAAAGADAIRSIRDPASGIIGKGSSGEFTTAADLTSESAILQIIRSERPGDAVLAEESGASAGSTGVRWVVDPLDGTVNFARGLDQFAVSVAAESGSRVVGAAICRPADGLVLVLDDDQCTSNQGRVAVAANVDPRRAVVAFAVPYDSHGRMSAYRHLVGIAPQVGDLRNSGSTVCDLAAVTLGRIDGFIGFGQKIWDIAAGLRMVGAAGGASAEVRLPAGVDMVVAGPQRLVDAVLHWSQVEPEPGAPRSAM